MRIFAHSVGPRFGFGGVDAQGAPRPLPRPESYRVKLSPEDASVDHAGKIQISPQFVQNLYRRVFRQSLEEPGAVLIDGVGALCRNNIQRVRAFQVALGEQIACLRNQALGVDAEGAFSLKYLGRANKAKLNPMHCDTKSTDSVVLMVYEPATNIVAYPFFTDLAQYAKDKDLNPLALVSKENASAPAQSESYKVKTHYGHQIDAAHQKELHEQYSFDLSDLDRDAIQLVVFNDSIAPGAQGLAHGMRHLEIPDPAQPSERPFNHVVVDVQNRELGRADEDRVPPAEAPTYYEKGLDEAIQTPVSVETAVSQYVETGKIFYRNPVAQTLTRNPQEKTA